MIAKLKGIVDSVDTDSAVIDVGGVGYLVSASSRTLRDLVAGGEATMLVETIVREDAINLYGFLETAERNWFLPSGDDDRVKLDWVENARCAVRRPDLINHQ